METRILFSPIGGTDPISQNNCRDGSMLHIARYYQPDIIYLYLSKEMLEFHKADNRYCYCIDRLSELVEKKMEVRIIERPELVDVQEFDFFYKEFKSIFDDIISKNPDAEILVNISSGTPSMKSTLMVLTTFQDYPFKLIQVSTPVRKMNEHTHKGFDKELAWACDDDNDPEKAENRCSEVSCPSISELKQKETIKKHIMSYDYSAAIAASKSLSNTNNELNDLLQMAQSRLALDIKNARNIAIKYQIDDIFPVKKDGDIKCFEYALSLDIKRKKQEYADFIRALTPLLVNLFDLILKKNFNIDYRKYCKERDNVFSWESNLLVDTDVQNYLDAWYKENKGNNFRGYGQAVSSDHLRALIIGVSHSSQHQDTQMFTIVDTLRNIEENVRNNAAHEINMVTEEYIKTKAGIGSSEIMNLIKKAFTYSGINIKKDDWNAYDRMNEIIISKI